MSQQLNEIHADIGALQAQMTAVLGSLGKIENVITKVALQEERTKNLRIEVDNHGQYIEAAKKRQWVLSGAMLVGSAVTTAAVNYLSLVYHP